MKRVRLSMRRRIVIILLVVFGGSFLVIFARLFKLQVFDHQFYAERALKQQMSQSTISPTRGNIYDRNMVPLAESATVWDVIASPKYITSDTQRQNIADNLSKILGIDRTTLYTTLKKSSAYEVIAKKIDQTTAESVTKYINTSHVGSIGLIEDSKRYYPYGNFASQLLGFTGSDNQGLGGLEAEYDSVLKGVPGRSLTVKTAQGLQLSTGISDYVPAQNGYNLVTTIDEVVQHYLEEDLSKAAKDNNVAKKATGIVMNVNTGEILAMATTSGFDPNSPFVIADSATAASLSKLSGDALKQATSAAQQSQWQNKAVSYAYEPGSTFKVITSAAALDDGKVTENDTFRDPGTIKVADRNYHDWDSANHGTVSFLTAFENSLNVVYVQVGQRLGPLDFYRYFSGFGLTQKTGIDLPGEAGSIYYNAAGLTDVSLASSSFGQTFKITPIQLITAVAASANGGYLVQPHVVKAETDSDGNIVKSFKTTEKRQVVSAETSKEIDHLMEMEVNEGSGKNAYVAGYRIGGKTGTAQKTDTSEPDKYLVASFIGIAPCDDPQYAVLIMLDEPNSPINNYGSTIAAPVAGDLFSQILPYLGVTAVNSDAAQQAATPNLSGKTVADATKLLSDDGLKIHVMGNGQTVTGQSPGAGSVMEKGGTVYIYTGDAQPQSTSAVPNLIGLSPSKVSSTLAAASLNVQFVGLAQDSSTAAAYEQETAQDTKVTPGTVIVVKFRDTNLARD